MTDTCISFLVAPIRVCLPESNGGKRLLVTADKFTVRLEKNEARTIIDYARTLFQVVFGSPRVVDGNDYTFIRNLQQSVTDKTQSFMSDMRETIKNEYMQKLIDTLTTDTFFACLYVQSLIEHELPEASYIRSWKKEMLNTFTEITKKNDMREMLLYVWDATTKILYFRRGGHFSVMQNFVFIAIQMAILNRIDYTGQQYTLYDLVANLIFTYLCNWCNSPYNDEVYRTIETIGDLRNIVPQFIAEYGIDIKVATSINLSPIETATNVVNTLTHKTNGTRDQVDRHLDGVQDIINYVARHLCPDKYFLLMKILDTGSPIVTPSLFILHGSSKKQRKIGKGKWQHVELAKAHWLFYYRLSVRRKNPAWNRNWEQIFDGAINTLTSDKYKNVVVTELIFDNWCSSSEMTEFITFTNEISKLVFSQNHSNLVIKTV